MSKGNGSFVIRTDHRWRQFQYRHDVPEKVLESEFVHLPEAFDGFFRYRKWWFHVSDFIRIPSEAADLRGWHGYAPDSFFSGVLIKLSEDGEAFQVGTYLT
jgi:hypothetical protein